LLGGCGVCVVFVCAPPPPPPPHPQPNQTQNPKIPNPQSPIPNPQSPIYIDFSINLKMEKRNKINNIKQEKNKKENEEEAKLKSIKLENEYLSKQIKEKDIILNHFKKQYNNQKLKIVELRKKINELSGSSQNYHKKPKKDSNNKKSKEQINEDYEKKLAITAVEQQILEELSKNGKIGKNKKISDSLKNIQTIEFDVVYATFFQCGICMDNFQDGENINKLHCGHLFHKECLNQWIQKNKNCILCGGPIF